MSTPYPSNSVTETLITAIDVLGAPPPSSYGLGELLRDFDNALDDFVAGGGGGGGSTIFEYSFNYTASTASGVAFFVPTVSTWLRDFWIAPNSFVSGLTPKADIGFFDTGPDGILVSIGANPINMFNLDTLVPNNAEIHHNTESAGLSSAIQTLGFTTGPPVPRFQMQFANSGGQPLILVISQDGTLQTAVAASLVATAAPSGGFPYPVTTGTNDNFNYAAADPVNGGGAAVSEKFTIAQNNSPGYGSIGALATAIQNASGTASDTFGEYCTVTNNGSVLTIEAVSFTGSLVAAGAASNGNLLIAGSLDATAGLGFTNRMIFTGGLGGSPGTGGGTIYLDIATPA